ncbi:AAA family ATPase [Bifidobacterium boum]|uniref:Chromosome partition protein Smc n=1 Tax=Bifidobacterium boum TaxID=78343 RepID=A0A848D6I2_9BIFI|nr:AAA family ATPase [Bifidobacterium boum]NMF02053.1 AAA family ATPase [Bifidobacterium boum]
MYLKELTLRGFKSFANPTTLRFEPGVTAVVGPNGSGKSNIVDALTWVMGEQGAKNLRGTSMEDVIFAGTSTRPPAGRAQVSLTIDNTDHALDIDYTEVTISRTLYRNGGSEYAINGSSCRLLDIQELLSDSGLGQQMHVIVGQGRLDAILRADPSGHRAFIEEAAGILKHRKRKERALRKLANTEDNLARLDDLLREIHRQLGPLGRQARVSRRADTIQMTIRDAQSRLFADDACQLRERRDSLRSDLADTRRRLAALQQDLAKAKVRIEQVEAITSGSNPQLAQANQTWHDLSRLEERFSSLASVAAERAASIRSQIVTDTGENPDMLAKRADELERQADKQRATVDDARLAYDQATEARADHERRLASIRQTLTELRKTAQQRDAHIANLRELVAREESAVHAADTRIADLSTQRSDMRTQVEQAKTRVAELDQERQDADDDGGAALDAARQALQHSQEQLDEALDRQRETNGKIISLQAKADALADTLDSRNAAGELESDQTIAVMGRLSDFIRIKEGWEEAVAHALGDYASAIVVPGVQQMLAALERAQDHALGKAVLLHPLDRRDDAGDATVDAAGAVDVADAPGNVSIADIADAAGNDHTAAALVGANPHAHDPTAARRVVAAVRALLADTVVKETRSEALDAVNHGPWTRAVTRQGEILTAVGAQGGSSLSQSDLSLAAKRDKALADMQSLRSQLDGIDETVAELTARRDQARLDVDRQAQLRTEARVKAQQAQRTLKAAQERVQTAGRQLARVEETLHNASQGRDDHQNKLEDLRKALTAAQESQGMNADLDELAAREHQLEQRLGQTREQEVSAKLAWKEADRQAQSLQRQIGLLRDSAEQAKLRQARIQEQNETRRQRAEAADHVSHDAAACARLAHASAAGVAQRRDRLQAELSTHDEELKALRAERDRLEPQVQRLQRDEHELDVERERQAAAWGQLTQKVADTLGMDMDELVDQYSPDHPVPVLSPDHAVPATGRKQSAQSEGKVQKQDMKATAGMTSTVTPTPTTATTQVQNQTQTTASAQAEEDAPSPATVPYVRQEQVKRLERAQRDLKALGKVNPLAAEEYEALNARNQYLHDQRDDVAKSRQDLLKLVQDLDQTMVSVFSSAFDDTAAAFQHVFATLFPGGTGRLRLEDPNDMLGTGVIVEASPAGKRVKQLSLLSGGERSLTALALLFAIFTARPSPFYVMDEVEAALDDVNLTRLLDALDDLREHAQLIIITHQQRTMAIADALYGITMRADGVSAAISQRLERHG